MLIPIHTAIFFLGTLIMNSSTFLKDMGDIILKSLKYFKTKLDMQLMQHTWCQFLTLDVYCCKQYCILITVKPTITIGIYTKQKSTRD